MRIDGERAVDQHHERVAVGRGPGDLAGGNSAVPGGEILDDHRLPQRFRQPLRQRAGDEVVGAARSRGHDQLYGFGWVGVLGAGGRHAQH